MEHMEQRKELIDARYVNDDDTEILRFAVYRSRGKYYLLIHRYKNWLYTNDFSPETLFYREEIIVGIGNAVQALRQAIQEYSTDMTIEFLYIDKSLASRASRANITLEENLNERLEKLYQAFQAQKERTRKSFPSP